MLRIESILWIVVLLRIESILWIGDLLWIASLLFKVVLGVVFSLVKKLHAACARIGQLRGIRRLLGGRVVEISCLALNEERYRCLVRVKVCLMGRYVLRVNKIIADVVGQSRSWFLYLLFLLILRHR